MAIAPDQGLGFAIAREISATSLSKPSEYLDDQSLVEDPAPLSAWLAAEFGDAAGSLRLERVAGGSSNSLLKLHHDGRSFALRRSPAVSNDKSSHNLAREARLLRALAKTAIPHARLIAAELDPKWLGGPFVLLDWVDGFTPRDPMPAPFDQDPALRRRLGEAVIDALADIARVDWRGVGLEDFGRPEGFLERQVDRWLSQYERYRTRDIPQLDDVAQWLRCNRPEPSEPGLMHGDYSLANVMVAADAPARIAAVIDWELATIGDPLLDLGHLLSSWGDATTGPTWAHYVDWDKGFMTRRAAAERYAARAGRSIAHVDYYIVLALFRLAVMLEGSYSRWVAGKSDNPRHAAFERRVPDIIDQAARTIRAG